MESVSFKQKFSKRAKYVTVSAFVLCVAIFAWLFFRSTASFLSAWFLLLSVSLILLFWIGMPKKTILTDYGIRLSCTLKLVTIDNVDQISIEPVTAGAIPVFATMGFLGYVGFYYFRRDKLFSMVMARSMSNLVLIRFDDNRKIVVGVTDVEQFLETAESFGYKILR